MGLLRFDGCLVKLRSGNFEEERLGVAVGWAELIIYESNCGATDGWAGGDATGDGG